MFKKLKRKVCNNKVFAGASVALMTALPAVNTFAAAPSTTMIDTSKIDFTPLVTTVSAVIGVALVPMITVAAGKKGLSFVKTIINKIG